jgi:beta-phosphoglucomutase
MKYKAVLFDMDGVIVDSEQLHFATFKAALEPHGYDLTDEHYKQHFMGKTDKLGLQLYFDFMQETAHHGPILTKKARSFLELAADQLISYPGVLEFIRDLAKCKVPMALVTGSLRAEAEIVLKTFGITDLFSVVIPAEDVVNGKPDPEGYLKGAKALGVKPADCVVIEDAASGVKAAKAAGIRCVAVTSTHTAEELAEATYIVEGLLPGSLELL